jgi:endonuclease/exonuclease/phosphatase family metal-dependent hydrolase
LIVQRIRIVTYNVHRCRGLDRRVAPERIADVLREIDADIIALQEVLSIGGAGARADQARFLAEALGFHHALGENRKLRGGAYGNVTLSRLPLHAVCNHDLSVSGAERRGCLRADVELGHKRRMHIFNVHLGTAFLERRHQARKLIAAEVIGDPDLSGPRIVLGDFNEWTRGLVTRLLSTHLNSVDIATHLRRRRTYPGVLPFMHLDHIYYDPELILESLTLHRSRRALIASDHLPLLAEFSWSK